MCPPTHYTIAYEINPWMHLRRPAARRRAQHQWRQLYRLLRRQLRCRVRLIRPVAGLPDLVFTANAGLVHGRMFIPSRFRYPQRQGESPVFERYFRQAGFKIKQLRRAYCFEGEGDALWVGSTLLVGFRFRSDAPVHEELARVLGARVLPVELVDRRFYHLDTCFCPLDVRRALWFPGAFDRYGRKVITGLVDDPIAVSAADAARFACNAIVVGRTIVLHDGCSRGLQRQLERRGYDVRKVDLSEFLKAGGSAKCLVLQISSKQEVQSSK